MDSDVLGISLLGLAYTFVAIIMVTASPNPKGFWKNFFFKVAASVLWPISIVGMIIQRNQNEEP